MGDFRMPSLGADMDVGTIVEWLVSPGDEVHRGQVVAVVDTAKAAIEIEAFEDGVVAEIVVGTGTQVPVGTTLARIVAAAPVEPAPTPPPLPLARPPVRHLAHQLGVDLDRIAGSGPDGHITHNDVLRAAAAQVLMDQPPAEPVRAAEPVAPVEPRPVVIPEAAGPKPAPVAGGVPARTGRATPRARRLAAARGIDIAGLAGTGGGGAVLGADVERDVERRVGAVAPPAGPAPARSVDAEKKAAMRSAIATLMSRAAAEIPHYYVTQTMDLAGPLAWLRAHNAKLPARQRVLPAALLMRATVIAALQVPDLNGHWLEGRLQLADQVDLGVAVATRGGGLVTPAILDAGGLGIDELMARLGDMVRRARHGNLRQSEMAGATITVSSLGESGPDALYGVIFPPQVALVCVGGIVDRPWAVDGMLTVRPTVTIALAADHRASDGRTASAFLAAFAGALTHPEEM
ncbi:MAG: dihydrolipoamide acetyltransferase family protein [Candidatus Nanopelagicales bacterium]